MQLRSLLFPILTLVLLAGCGGGDPANTTPTANKLAASSTCLNCHASAVSPTTGALIGDEWRSSSHNLNNGAGCADCHEPASDHPNACGVCHGGGLYQVTKNPDQAGKCFKCHGPAFPDNLLMALAPQHFGYSSARALPAAIRASYVSGQYQGRCGACHNPHNNTLTQQHRDYATSLHGDPKGAAWTHYDFKLDSYAACSRCHTSTGFISFVSSGFTVATKGFGAGDTSREMLACDACHTSYDFKNSVRKVPAYSATYQRFDGLAPASFPDVAESNICIPCHAGRDSGGTINAFSNLTGVSFVNSHYLAAAGLVYMKVGFVNFTSSSAATGVAATPSYGQSLSPDLASTPDGVDKGTTSVHRKLGTILLDSDSHKPLGGGLDQNGPCVTCHLNASGVTKRPGSGHTLKIDANAYQQVCINCHTSENNVAINPNGSDFRTIFLDPQSEAFQDSLKLMQKLLLDNFQISFNQGVNPYFFDETLPRVNGAKQPVRNWVHRKNASGNPVTANGKKLMGACFNLNLLARDPAAYAHAHSFSRRLVYDSIDYLDNGVMDLSVGATARTQSLLGTSLTDNPVFGLYTQGAKAYNSTGSGSSYAMSTPAAGTSEAMLYLIGWTRSGTTAAAAGAWTSPERP